MRVLTWNVKGLRSPNKRTKLLRFLKRYRPDVVFLQETHLELSDFHRVAKFWVGQVYGSSSVQRKAGVLTLINKSFSHSVISHTSDAEGRESILVISREGKTTALCNIYGPNGDNSSFYQNLGVTVRGLSADMVILGGDLNTVLSPSEDRRPDRDSRLTQTIRSRDKVLTPFLDFTGLTDAWRDAHPEGRDFTHYSHVHHSWSRLDYMLISRHLSPKVITINIGPLVISDHAPVILQLEDTNSRGGDFVWRFPAYMVRDDSFSELLRGWWLEYCSTNEEHMSDPALFWNAAKAVMRGRIMAYVANHKKKTNRAYEDANRNLRAAYTSFQNCSSPQNRERWLQSKREFEVWVERREAFYRSQFDAEMHRFGNKSGKLLANLARGRRVVTHITALKSTRGTTHTNPKQINNIFQDYYRSLYFDHSEPDSVEQGVSFLDRVRLPTAGDEHRELLNKEISEIEILQTIKGLGLGKAPGPDGFSGEFYKTLQAQVSPTLVLYYNAILESGGIRPESKNAFIKLLPKPGRDPLQPGSYRPISLIDQDLKILSKILANRLATFLPQLIGPSQVGFVQGRSAVGNIRKVLAVLDRAKCHMSPTDTPVLLAVDAEKAFDNVRWEWLNIVLDRFGITGRFRTYLTDVYTAPTAQIHTSGCLSPAFPLLRGTRQGCPLSPLLFNLALEPLARFLEDSNLYKGIRVGQQEVKIALFADDVLLFLSDPVNQLKSVLQTMSHFGTFSGYRINADKSELLELNPQASPVSWSGLGITIKTAPTHITYLGIKIGRRPESLYSLNYVPLINKILAELGRWSHLPLPLLGRCHLIRMMSFARLLYPLQTLPLLIKHRDITKLNSAFTKFIWAGKRPRIAIRKLMMSKPEGGLNFPNIRGYNLACLLRHALDWYHGTNCFSNWALEASLAHPWSLLALLHTKVSSLPKDVKWSLTLRDTVIAWREVRKIYGLPVLVSKYMPLWGHPQSPPNVNSSFCNQELLNKGISRVQHIIHRDLKRWMTPDELIAQYSLSSNSYYTLMQVISFCKSRLRNPTPECTAHQFDDLLSISPGYYGISRLYCDVNKKLIGPIANSAYRSWEKVFTDPDVVKVIQGGWANIRKHVICETWRDTYFRFIHRAIYGFEFPRTPSNPDRIVACPKCQTPFTDLWHGVWLCPAIQRFWDQVITYIDLHWRLRLPKTPRLLLFHCTQPPDTPDLPDGAGEMEDIRIPTLIHSVLLLVKRCIFQKWLDPQTPDVDMVTCLLKSNLFLDKTYTERHKDKGTKGFFKKWKTFIVTHFSDEEIRELMKIFLHTRWYNTECLRGSLGRLLLSEESG